MAVETAGYDREVLTHQNAGFFKASTHHTSGEKSIVMGDFQGFNSWTWAF